MQKGDVLNPKGRPPMSDERKEARGLLSHIRASVFRGKGDMGLAAKCLAMGVNADAEQLKALMGHENVPVLAKVIIKEAVSDPAFALRVLERVMQAYPPQKEQEDEESAGYSPMEDQSTAVNVYVQEIKAVLVSTSRYNSGLDMQIYSLASAMRAVDMANQQIDRLGDVTYYEESKYGRKLAQHPAFKILTEAQASVTRQMKALGLTAENLGTDEAETPLVALTRKLADTK